MSEVERLLDKSFDFSVRITELIKYLERENKSFPLSGRLLECAAGIGVCMKQAASAGSMSFETNQKTMSYASEAEYLLELMEKTEYMTEKQSRPILGDCRGLMSAIAALNIKQKGRD